MKVEIAFPAWANVKAPDLSALAGADPVGFFKSVAEDALGQFGSAGGVATMAASALQSFTGIIGTASVAAGPAAPFVAAASGLLSIFGSLFGGDTPPPPLAKIGGEDANDVYDNPFKTLGRAIAAGRIVGSHAEAPKSFSDVVQNGLRNTVTALRDSGGKWQAASDKLKARYGFRISAAAMCAAVIDYEELFKMLADPERDAKEVGRLLAYAAPRLRVHSLLTCMHYQLATATIETLGDKRKFVKPAGLARRFDADEGGALPSADWMLRAVALAFPVPRKIRDGVWAYEPWPTDIARAWIDEIEKSSLTWHDFGPAGRIEIGFPGKLFALAMASGSIPTRTKLSASQAANSVFKIAESEGGFVRGHMDVFRDELAKMQSETGLATVRGVFTKVRKLKAKEAETVKRLVMAKAAMKMLNQRRGIAPPPSTPAIATTDTRLVARVVKRNAA